MEEITIEGARITQQTMRGIHPGEPLHSATLSVKVGYDDLDIGTAEGAKALGERVHSASKLICDELDRMFKSGDPDCVKRSADKAMKQADRVIKAYKK